MEQSHEGDGLWASQDPPPMLEIRRKARTKKKAKKDMFLSDVAGQILKFIIRYKNKERNRTAGTRSTAMTRCPRCFPREKHVCLRGGPDRENRY